MDSRFFRKYIDILSEQAGEVISQQDLMSAYLSTKPTPTGFVKTAIEAIIPKASELGKAVENKIRVGTEDNVNYNENQPYIVIQGKKNGNFEAYTNSAETLKQKIPNANPDSLIMGALNNLGISLNDLKKSGGGLFKKPSDAVVHMIPAKSLGVENRTIDAGWGTQDVKPGAFLVLEKYPNTANIYCVNPDEDGLPIGYIKA